MNAPGKWLARAGALLIMLGFVLPVMTVSCSAMPEFGRSFSMVDLVSQADQPTLYLVPFGALVAIVLSLLPVNTHSSMLNYFWGQVVGFVAGILSLAITLISLNDQINNLFAFDINPEFGLFILIVGYILAAIGLIVQWQEINKYRTTTIPSRIAVSPPAIQQLPINQPAISESSGPRLEAVRGNSPTPFIPIRADNFMIGRSSENDLQLHDMKISRQHACIRFAQGAWYIQDRESSGGIMVNDQPVQAIRLNSEDKITIGEETFVFYA